MAPLWDTSDIRREYTGADLGDARLNDRLVLLGETLAKAPGSSFPKGMGSEAGLEAAYRFLNNPRVETVALLAPHRRETSRRAEAMRTVLAIHDTTEFTFSGAGQRNGLGRTRAQEQGFFGHVTLLVEPGEARVPLGVVGVRSWSRTGRRRWRHAGVRAKDPGREAVRWFEQAEEVEAQLDREGVVHVMDREADFYDLLWRFVEQGRRFVTRATGSRNVLVEDNDAEGPVRVRDVPQMLPTRYRRTVPLSCRSRKKHPNANRYHRSRQGRTAKLRFSSCVVTLRRPRYGARTWPKQITLHMVCVREEDPPAGEQPVDWVLFTSEPIETAADIVQVVDFYRSRWVIEEFFKALKTGCAFERRQLESFAALRRALALFLPIAWQLLRLRGAARASPRAPLAGVLAPRLVQILRAVSSVRLSQRPTVQEGVAALARLGGHLPRNGRPGWQTIGAGYQELLTLARGWEARERCDQS